MNTTNLGGNMYRIESIKGILKLVSEFPDDIIAKKIDDFYFPEVSCPECAGKGIIYSDGFSKNPEICEECQGNAKIKYQREEDNIC